MQRILIVDDETILLETIAYNLEQEGYQVMTASDGRSALAAARQETPDLILLDIMMPEMDGLETCRQLRQRSETAKTPILFLTARAEEVDKVVGLEVGADDYLTKPFGRRELLARVRALLRRSHYSSQHKHSDPSEEKTGSSSPPPPSSVRITDTLRIDYAGRQVNYRGRVIDVQPKQFDLLAYLIRNRGKVLTRSQLLQSVWGYDYAGDTRTVDVHVRWLREKLEEDPGNPQFIQTVRGVGYVIR